MKLLDVINYLTEVTLVGKGCTVHLEGHHIELLSSQPFWKGHWKLFIWAKSRKGKWQ